MTESVANAIDAIVPKSVTLTKCQRNALGEIYQWHFDKSRTTHTLMGSAGTGKSFTTNLVRELLANGSNIAISAPTHKAKRVVQDFTGLEGVTIHSLLGLRLATNLEEFDINNVKFDHKAEPKIKYYSHIIIDEASMINVDLFNLLVKEAKEHGSKLLFVGDPLQLPPVGEDSSPAFNLTDSISRLVEPARQSLTNPLYLILTALRCDIQCNEENINAFIDVARSFGYSCSGDEPDFIIDPTRTNLFSQIYKLRKEWESDGAGYEFLSEAEFKTHVDREFASNDFADDINHCRYLAFTNNNITTWNNYIRNNLFDLGDNFLAIGDLLLSYLSIYGKDNQLVIQNSDEYIVEEITPDVSSVTILFGDRAKSVDIPVNHILLRNVLSNIPTRITVCDYEDGETLRQKYSNFISAHSYFLKNGRSKRQWSQYYKFRDNHLVIDDLKRLLKSNDVPSKNLDYAYGITVHKSQGSTFNHVFVNMPSILEYMDIAAYHIEKRYGRPPTPQEAEAIRKFTLKLLYVALSRAKYKAYILK